MESREELLVLEVEIDGSEYLHIDDVSLDDDNKSVAFAVELLPPGDVMALTIAESTSFTPSPPPLPPPPGVPLPTVWAEDEVGVAETGGVASLTLLLEC